MYAVATVVCLAVVIIYVNSNCERQLDGKIAVVTGGAKGIGRAIVDNFAKNGAKTVIFVDKDLPRGLKTEEELGHIYGANRILFIHGDITKDLDTVSKKIINIFGCVHILVNNAAILDEHNPELMIKTNVLGTTLWTQRFFECMRKDKGGKGGTIMNISSMSAYMREPFSSYYKTTKFAILGLSVGLGHEFNYLNTGVRIFTICPSFTRTDMTLKQRMVVVEQQEIFDKVRDAMEWQSADAVGRGAALLYKTGTTGMAYSIAAEAPPTVSPDSLNITVEYLLSL